MLGQSGYILLRRTEQGYAKGIRVRDLIAKYSLRSLRSYQIDARREINKQRQSGVANKGAAAAAMTAGGEL